MRRRSPPVAVGSRLQPITPPFTWLRPGLAGCLAVLLLFAQPPASAKAPAENVAQMPGFELPDLEGVRHRLAAWRGRVIVINFWASWCPPCQYEIRDFVEYQAQYGGRGLQIVGIGVDRARRLRNAARTLEINYPTLVPGEKRGWKLLKQWGDRRGVLPYTVIIARDGRITYTQLGPLDRTTFEEQVLPLL